MHPAHQRLQERLLLVEDEFLLAMEGDEDYVQRFHQEYTALLDDIYQAPSLPQEIRELAATVGSRISIIASAFLELEQSYEQISESLETACLAIENSEEDEGPSSSSQPDHSKHTGLPRYLPMAYNWLLDNLHNPYPSATYREVLAQETHCRRKDIDGWFIDVRKRIGWNELRKKHFKSRKEMVEVATRIYAQGASPDLHVEIECAFQKIKRKAQHLYQQKLYQTDIATQLIVEDARDSSPDSTQFRSPKMYYPSPAPSSSRSCSPSLHGAAAEYDSLKSDLAKSSCSTTTYRPSTTLAQVLPSPPISNADIHESLYMSPPVSTSWPASTVSRKRHRSDSPPPATSKRLCEARRSTPDLQSSPQWVPDLASCSGEVSESTGIDAHPEGPLDVSLFNTSTFGEQPAYHGLPVTQSDLTCFAPSQTEGSLLLDLLSWPSMDLIPPDLDALTFPETEGWTPLPHLLPPQEIQWLATSNANQDLLSFLMEIPQLTVGQDPLGPFV